MKVVLQCGEDYHDNVHNNNVNSAITDNKVDVPSNLNEVNRSRYRKKWYAAMQSEFNSIAKNRVWKLVPPPPDNRTSLGFSLENC